MKKKNALLMILLLTCLLTACNEEKELSTDNVEIVGNWSNPVYEEPYWKYEKVQTLQDGKYGFSFDKEQVFIERKNAGECATPPIAYDNFYGNWTQTDSIIHIRVDYWGGKLDYEWKIISIDNKYLIVDKIKEEIVDEKFCPFVNVGNIDKIGPSIDEFLTGLNNDLTTEQQLQEMTMWLKSHACITDATIRCNSCIHTNLPMSEIAISFIENGITKNVILDIKMANPLKFVGCHEDFVPTTVLVKTKNYFTIDKVFDFINSFDHTVEDINYGVYNSTMQSDSLQYILDCLNAKPYTNDGKVWFVTGYLHYQTNQITIFPRLFNMKNKDYQADWLKSMIDYKLIEKTENIGYVIHFHVPEGTEKEWETKFKEYEFVEWSTLNNFIHVILGSNI
jgi:hypothetical protein